MLRPIAVTSIVVSMLALVPYSNGTQRRSKSHKTPAPVVQDQPDPVAAPQPSPTPEQGPSSPPEVNYQHGQLTITARNSTMSDVLNAVKQKTGAAVDMPAVTSERVAGQFGPGAPRDVMAQLLNGSHYDYVLLGSPADPGALNKIVLTARVSGPEPAPPTQPQMGANQPPMGANQTLPSVPDVDTDQTSEDSSTDVPQPDMQQAPEEEPQPDQESGQSGQPGQPVVKTPEQLLRELQQQQQQQQQQQNQSPQRQQQ